MSKFQTYPEGIRVLEMGLGVPLLSVDEVGEFGRVTDEEDGSVVEHPIPITFLSPELESEPTRVTSGIGRAGFTTDGGDTSSDANLLADALEEGLGGDIAQIMSDLEVTVGTGSLGVDLRERGNDVDHLSALDQNIGGTYNTLWDTLTIEVGKEIDMVEI